MPLHPGLRLLPPGPSGTLVTVFGCAAGSDIGVPARAAASARDVCPRRRSRGSLSAGLEIDHRATPSENGALTEAAQHARIHQRALTNAYGSGDAIRSNSPVMGTASIAASDAQYTRVILGASATCSTGARSVTACR